MIEKLYDLYLRHPQVTTDSRQCPAGGIFFALKGERFDGNRYASEVLDKGCALAVVDDASVVDSARKDQYFLVPDVLQTLQQLAAYHRRQLRTWARPVRVLGITGTNGKTTTKELLRAVLSEKYSVLATQGNLNNHIGVPLTLLSITQQHEVAIIEMGANHPLDIQELCDIVHPDFGLITNVGKAHLLGFGSLEGVIEAKTKLYDSLRRDGGVAFVDMDNEYLAPRSLGMPTIPYLEGQVVDSSPFLRLEIPELDIDIQTNLIGLYNLTNVVAAATVGRYFRVDADDIRSAIENYTPQNMRSQLIDLGMGRQLILDAYNANPTSMMAALTSFALHRGPHKMAVLGDMRELGTESAEEHAAILRYLASEPTIGNLFLVGEQFMSAYEGLTEDILIGLGRSRSVRCYRTVEDLLADASALNYMGGTILVKGSRGVQLEKLANRLKENA